jgi:formylglycine-generating enzyme required for sulfatase activity
MQHHRLRLLAILAALVLFAFCRPAEGAQVGEQVGAQENATLATPAPGERWVEPWTGMAFRWIPTGCYTMGSDQGEPGHEFDEGPQHEVCLTGFWMGETEVTQGQWSAVMGSNPSLIQNGEEHPVDMVSWNKAQEFVEAMNRKAGGRFRLPTEAEWEYACRAGAQTAYSFGDSITTDQASFDRSFRLQTDPPAPRRKSRKHRRRPPVKKPQPSWSNMHTSMAGSFPANAWGLRDMHGNLWEWCQDVYDDAFYSRSAKQDPVCGEEGSSRVLRGGSWVTKAEALRSANRSSGWPDMDTAFYGVRLVRYEPVSGAQAKASAVSAGSPRPLPVAVGEDTARRAVPMLGHDTPDR